MGGWFELATSWVDVGGWVGGWVGGLGGLTMEKAQIAEGRVWWEKGTSAE